MNHPNLMTAREYLEQAQELEQVINAKLSQLSALHALSRRVTATLSDMPRSASGSTHPMENIIVRLVGMEQEIDEDVDRLIDMKQEMADYLRTLPNADCGELLAHRYVSFMSWKRIAAVMHYTERYVYKLHMRALEMLESVLPEHKRVRQSQGVVL